MRTCGKCICWQRAARAVCRRLYCQLCFNRSSCRTACSSPGASTSAQPRHRFNLFWPATPLTWALRGVLGGRGSNRIGHTVHQPGNRILGERAGLYCDRPRDGTVPWVRLPACQPCQQLHLKLFRGIRNGVFRTPIIRNKVCRCYANTSAIANCCRRTTLYSDANDGSSINGAAMPSGTKYTTYSTASTAVRRPTCLHRHASAIRTAKQSTLPMTARPIVPMTMKNTVWLGNSPRKDDSTAQS